MHIRKCGKKDARNVGIVHYRCWQETYRGIISDSFLDSMSEESDENKKEQYFAQYGKYWYVVEEESTIIGFISLIEGNNQYAKHEVEAIYLLKEHQKKGYGKKMFAFIKETFHNEPFYLWCLKNNPTLGFYEHMGGKIIDSKNEFVGEEVCLLFE